MHHLILENFRNLDLDRYYITYESFFVMFFYFYKIDYYHYYHKKFLIKYFFKTEKINKKR